MYNTWEYSDQYNHKNNNQDERNNASINILYFYGIWYNAFNIKQGKAKRRGHKTGL